MKKVVKSIIVSLLGATLATSVGVALAHNSKADQASAYSASSLPTTIDLNDTSASNIRSYYSSLNSLATNQRQGTNLLKNLKTILKNDQKYYSYENGTSIWQMYEITDRDWNKSPASSTTYGTYNSSTNKITNYTYGTSSSNSKNNPYIHALYINRDVNNQTTAWDDHQQDQWGINREHVWPKAEGFETEASGGARGDPMHLMAGNGYANNIHSNFYYGYVKTSSTYTDCGSKYSNQSGNLRGTSKTVDSGTVFEPQDCDKGDIARAIFYMVARYNYLSGSDSDGIDSNNPNLELTQDISNWSSSGYSSTTSRTGKMGILTDLLNWHHQDPVDEYEIHRNNLLYTNFTNNRNPFIDFPEWVDFIWGTAVYNGTNYQSYSPTPTGYATPSSDTINGYNGGGTDPVAVTGISLEKNATSITVGGSEVLSYTIAPNNATDQAVTWTSSNNNVATVSDTGRVTGVAEGNATITVTTHDGSHTATCAVTVTASGGGGGGDPVDDKLCAKSFGGYTDSSYSAAGTDYTGVANLTNTSGATYSLQVFNGSTGQVRGNQSTPSANFSARNTTTYSGYYISQVSLTVDSGGTLDGSTQDRSVVWFGSSAYANPTTAPSAGTKVAASPASSGQQTLTWTNSNTNYNYFILYNLKAASAPKCKDADTPLTITWTPKSTPSSKTLSSITLDTEDVNKSFYVGDTFDFEGLGVTAHYTDLTEDVVIPSNVSSPDMTTAGTKTVTVSYTEGGVTKTATYQITVESVTLTSIEISGYTTSFVEGDSFAFGGTVIVYYSNSTSENVTTTAEFTGYDMTTVGNQTVTVSFGGLTQTYSITVSAGTLSAISVSGYTSAYSVGDSFSFDGTCTAEFENGYAKIVTPTSVSSPDMSSAGNKTITVSYTYNGKTKSTSYNITVSESGGGASDDTQFALINSTSDLEANKSYIITNGTSGTVKAIAVTSNANNRKTTDVTVSSNKITRGSSVMSLTLGGSTGAWTFATENYAGTDGYLASADASGTGNHLRVISTAATATISFDNDAAVIHIGPHGSRDLIRYNPNSGSPIFACYSSGQQAVYLWKEVVTKNLSSISLNTDNVQKTFSVGDTFNYTGLVVTANYSDSSSATVTPTGVSTPDMSSTGQKTVTVAYTENGVSKTATYNITVSSSPSISWTAPSIDVYSGSTLSGSDVNSWAVTYNDGAGHQTVLTYSQLTVKLGGTTISIPYTWSSADDGKTLTATYNGLTTTQSSAIRVTQNVNSIVASISQNYDYTFESKTIYNKGSVDLGGYSWTMSGTDDGNPFFGYDSTKGQQFGSGTHPFTTISLQSSAFSGTIDSVTVYTSGANSINATVQVSVGGTAYGDAETITNTNTAYTFDLGGKSGTISIDYVNSSSKAIYVKEIVVNSTLPATNIANSLDHIEAQRAAVKFAKAFNAAMDTTENCTTNLSSAWSTCSEAYNTFKAEAAALGSTEEAYAKNLIKYATAQYSDDSGEACIERMLKTYEVCVNKHGQTAFMNDLVSVGHAPVNPIALNASENINAVAIVSIVSLIGVSAIGGYFFLKKRKEQ